MIRSFSGKTAEQIWNEEKVRALDPRVLRKAYIKLELLNAATAVDELRSPPGNRLEALKGDRKGQHSIGINDQWWICFRWSDGGVDDVEIVDYH